MPAASDKSCATASFSSVQAAINAVANGGQVYLCGTTPFCESVAIQNKDVTAHRRFRRGTAGSGERGGTDDFFSSQGLETPNAVVTVIGSSNVQIDGLIVEGPFANTDCSG